MDGAPDLDITSPAEPPAVERHLAAVAFFATAALRLVIYGLAAWKAVDLIHKLVGAE